MAPVVGALKYEPRMRVSSIQHIMHECANTRTIHSGLVVRQHGCCVCRCSVASALQESVSVSLPSTPADMPLIPRTWCWVVVVFRPSLVFSVSGGAHTVFPFASVTPFEFKLSRKIFDELFSSTQGRSTMNVIHRRFQRNLRCRSKKTLTRICTAQNPVCPPESLSRVPPSFALPIVSPAAVASISTRRSCLSQLKSVAPDTQVPA